MLGASTMGTFFAAKAIASLSWAESPVVPITMPHRLGRGVGIGHGRARR